MNPDPLAELFTTSVAYTVMHMDGATVRLIASDLADWVRMHRAEFLAALDGDTLTNYDAARVLHDSWTHPRTGKVTIHWQLVLAPGEQVWVFPANEKK